MYAYINYSGMGTLSAAGGIDIYYKNKLQNIKNFIFFTKDNSKEFCNDFYTSFYLKYVRRCIKNPFLRSHFDWYFQLYCSLKKHKDELDYVEVPDSFGYGVVLHLLKIPYEVKLHTPHSVVVELNCWRKDFCYLVIKRLEKIAIKNATRIVSPSQAMADYLIDKGWSFKVPQIVILNNGLYKVNQNTETIEKKKQILFVGNLEPRKNLSFLIKNFIKNLVFDDYCLLICGNDSYIRFEKEYCSYWEYCLKTIPELKGNKRIQYCGFVNNEDLQSLYAESEFFIVPSTEFENFPTVILEAIKNRTIVIGSKVGGIPEIIKDGSEGFLFEDNDSNDFLLTIEHAMKCDKLMIQNQALKKLEIINLQKERNYVLSK